MLSLKNGARSGRLSKPARHHQYQDDDKHQTEAAAAVVARTVEWAASKPAEASKEGDDQNDKEDRSD
jgi:hypothetical protein